MLVTTTIASPPTLWCFETFSGSQLRASFYKVKLSECSPVPSSVVASNYPDPPAYQEKDEETLPVAPAAPSVPVQPTLFPPAPPELTTVPSDDKIMQEQQTLYKKFDFNSTQHVATPRNVVARRTQHVANNMLNSNVAIVWPGLYGGCYGRPSLVWAVWAV